MKLYKLSLLALALAGTMAACSDDEYTAPAATPGAFFPVESPDAIDLPFDGNSVDITVRRNTPNIPSDETFRLSLNDPSGLFSIPATVTFVGQELTATVPITYDPAKIETDKEYPVSITIDGMANKWGLTTYSFVLDRRTPLVETNLGVGQFVYDQLLSGYGFNYCIKSVNPLEPNLEYYTIQDWFDYPTEDNGIDLVLTVHTDKILPNGYPYVELPWTTLKYQHPSYAAVKVISYLDYVMWDYEVSYDFCAERGFYLELTDGTVVLTPDMLSYFDTDRGVFYIYDMYGAFNASDEYLGTWGDGMEYFYLPGYPDYYVELNYLGYFTNPDDEITAMGELYAGADVETVDVYNVAGDDVEEAIEAILNGEIEGQTIEIDTEDAISVKFEVPGAGTYTMIAIANANGEPMEVDYATYTISGAVVDEGNWQSIGEGLYTDGFVMPRYSINDVQLNPFEHMFKVSIEENLDVPGQYRLVSPYTSENYPLLQNNANTKPTNIVFDISDPDFPTLAFQYTGYKFSDGPLWVSDANWFFTNCMDYTPEEVINGEKTGPLSSYYEGDLLEIPLPLFAMTDDRKMSSNVDDLGYNWKGPGDMPYPVQIFMPSSTQAATAAKAIRKMVSTDNFVRSAKAVNIMSDFKHKGSKRQSNIKVLKQVNLQPEHVAPLR